MNKLELIRRTALPLLLCAPAAVAAQAPPSPLAPPAAEPAPAEEGEVAFTADELIYDEDTDVVTVTGEVRMVREGHRLRADRVIWDRRSGRVQAQGNVQIVSPAGDTAYADEVDLADTLREGVVANLLLVLEDGGRLAALKGRRQPDGATALYRAAYSPCPVVGADGCPREPTWQINAVRVVHDPVRRRIYYEGANLVLFGRPIVGLPGLSHPDSAEHGGSGLLVPDIRFSRRNGLEVSVPYYWRLAPNRDLTVTPYVFTSVLPMLEAHYRELTARGAWQARGFLTHGTRTVADPLGLAPERRESGVRAYLEGNGRFQLDPFWSVTGSARWTTDRSFLRRYDISRDDRLRSMVDAERIGADSYISIAGWAFQGLRFDDVQGQQPIAVPAIDARWRLEDPVWNGRIELQANSLSILRTEGQDTQRAFASFRWDRRAITWLGQEFTLTAFARGDLYHANDTHLTQTAIYRGEEGWNARAIGAVAADLSWPLIGEFLGGSQRLTPRVQLVASPRTENLAIPNEDARSVDLEDSNLFALNRFPGHDRWEDGVRLTYGADWAVDLPGVSLRTNVGQSYRLNQRPTILPPGTGLSDRWSDFVGRTTLRWGPRLSLVHRFRLDKDSLAVRRNEIDANWGSRQTYLTLGYLRLDRNIDPAIEDLRDREEVRLGGRIRVARYWSVFGSAVIDLTGPQEDPAAISDGFEPVRHRIGIAYEDECIELGVTWRRDYDVAGDLGRGSTFLFRVALKNLGR